MRRFTLFLLLGLTWTSSAAPRKPPASARVQPVVQQGGRNDSRFAVSPDGRFIASVSGSDLSVFRSDLKLWNRRGELELDLAPPAFAVYKPVFARDGKRLYLTGDGGTAVYSLPSGRKVREVVGAQVSDDGRFWIRRLGDILLSDTRTGKAVSKLAFSPTSGASPSVLSFSPDRSRVAVSRPRAGKIPVYAVQTGKLLFTLSDPRGAGSDVDGALGPVIWSLDGKLIATGGEDPDFREPTGPNLETESEIEAAYHHQYAVKVWNATNGHLERVWRGYGTDEDGVPLNEWISPDEVTLGGGYKGYDAQVLNVRTGKARTTGRIAPSRRERVVLINDAQSDFALMNARGRILAHFPRPGGAFDVLTFSPDGAHLAAASRIYGSDGRVSVLNTRTGALERTLELTPTGREGLYSLRWLRNGDLSASSLQSVWIWNPQGQLVTHFVPPLAASTVGPYSESVSVSPDGRLFLTAGNRWKNESSQLAHIFDTKGQVVRDIPDFGLNDALSPQWYERRLGWIDATHTALATKTGVEIWDVRAGTRSLVLTGRSDFEDYRPPLPSPDGHFLLRPGQVANGNKDIFIIEIFDLRSGQKIREMSGFFPLSWSGDSSRFVASDPHTGALQVFAPQQQSPLTPNPFVSFNALNQAADDALNRVTAVSPDFRLVASVVGDYAVASHVQMMALPNAPLVSLYLFGDEAHPSWLALRSDNFYDGSHGIERWLRWRRNNALLPVGALQKTLRRPDQIRAALR